MKFYFYRVTPMRYAQTSKFKAQPCLKILGAVLSVTNNHVWRMTTHQEDVRSWRITTDMNNHFSKHLYTHM